MARSPKCATWCAVGGHQYILKLGSRPYPSSVVHRQGEGRCLLARSRLEHRHSLLPAPATGSSISCWTPALTAGAMLCRTSIIPFLPPTVADMAHSLEMNSGAASQSRIAVAARKPGAEGAVRGRAGFGTPGE